MLVVILGAGASFDSVNIEHDGPLGSDENLPYRPPLAAELFAPRENFRQVLMRYTPMRPIVTRIRRRIADGILLEDELRAMLDEAKGYRPRHQQLLAVACYLQGIIAECTQEWLERSGHATHYHELVDVVEAWRLRQPRNQQMHNELVTYVTFNYDTMLEDALMTIYSDWEASDMSAYQSDHRFRLAKPHGSINWGRIVERPIQVEARSFRSWLWSNAGSYDLGGYMLGGGGVVKQSDSFGTVPAIAVPVHDKDAFECPEEHVFTIEAAVRSATKVLCVGWRGLEAEFLSKWSKRNAEMDLLIASGNSEFGAETWRNMTAGGFESRQPAIHDGGFGSLLGSSELATFLDRES